MPTASRRARRSTRSCGCQALVQSVVTFPVGRSQRSAHGRPRAVAVRALGRARRSTSTGHGHHELTPDTAAYIALRRVVLDRERRPRPARRARRRRPHAGRRPTRRRVEHAPQSPSTSRRSPTRRPASAARSGCSSIPASAARASRSSWARSPSAARPTTATPTTRSSTSSQGEGLLHMSRRDPPDQRRLVHLPAAAAHALPREHGRGAHARARRLPAGRQPGRALRRGELDGDRDRAATPCPARSATASRCSSTRSTSTAARRACSPTPCARPTRTT